MAFALRRSARTLLLTLAAVVALLFATIGPALASGRLWVTSYAVNGVAYTNTAGQTWYLYPGGSTSSAVYFWPIAGCTAYFQYMSADTGAIHKVGPYQRVPVPSGGITVTNVTCVGS